jgi:hypothetical protein
MDDLPNNEILNLELRKKEEKKRKRDMETK